jgi:hypothetical protein
MSQLAFACGNRNSERVILSVHYMLFRSLPLSMLCNDFYRETFLKRIGDLYGTKDSIWKASNGYFLSNSFPS